MNIFAANAVPADPADAKVLQIPNDADLPELARSGALQGVDRVELSFPKFTDGRAYSQAVLLRRRYGFKGEIRATGDVLIDQLLQMQRCGFDSAVLSPGLDPAEGRRQLDRFPGFYQGDALQPLPRFARRAA
ncbi:DUF934 domain-containing protein [Caldimonas thermodepolymerans]|jgi:Uncharacterized protein conserved in bacteria|uniref:Uncharacterized protein DUF934 n=1 Tax=Caldimonas thermodepolymerans TaxID=215580 RepID=A0A2S5T700_9BURK|nr:DUF934 domain-containing protein [Caldimonas thermodepolymerans]PPE70760.1 hypothetical protein C1702_04240 [Caldimonas thermodepolymerans]QPC32975.1 DUF934 domain-containing protein [Caldimonas thermodepolymerans]RDI03758.1 uncharacterized protein DUF934 [Caldimonas thermodepolymerans]TCP09725.1 uncharacterized protein DUF934 [Caldimonas thermodepolymerans]UZG45843.1 DUF934 domain-containing protein [Caldimonas thermodepolymerans]